MFYARMIMAAAIALFFWLLVKLCRSPKFDKFCKDIFSGKLDTESTSKEAIKDITKAETELGKQADQNTKEAERLKKESSQAHDYLNKRGVGSNDKEGSA